MASLAETFVRLLRIGPAAALAGLMHDLGKYNPDFQTYIAGGGPSVDHSNGLGRLAIGQGPHEHIPVQAGVDDPACTK